MCSRCNREIREGRLLAIGAALALSGAAILCAPGFGGSPLGLIVLGIVGIAAIFHASSTLVGIARSLYLAFNPPRKVRRAAHLRYGR